MRSMSVNYWTRGPAPLSKLTAQAVCRTKFLEVAQPVLYDQEEIYPKRTDPWLPVQLATSAFTLVRNVFIPPNEPSKLDILLTKGKLDIKEEEALNNLISRIEDLSNSLSKPELSPDKTYRCLLETSCWQYHITRKFTSKTLNDDVRREVGNALAAMPEFDNSPLAVFLFTFVTANGPVQLARWKKKKDRRFPSKISGFFETVLPRLPKGFITELRLVNVEITNVQALEQLLLHCHEHLISLECGVPSYRHLYTIVKYGKELKHLKIEGQPSPISIEHVTLAFFGKSFKKVSNKEKYGDLEFALPNLQSIHVVKLVNRYQNSILTYMSLSSPALNSVKANYMPLYLEPIYPQIEPQSNIEELFVDIRILTFFLQTYSTLDDVFPNLKNLHLDWNKYDVTDIYDSFCNGAIQGLTLYSHGIFDFRDQWLESIYPLLLFQINGVRSLSIKAYTSMCYNVLWSLFMRFDFLESFSLDNDVESYSPMRDLMTDINLSYLHSFSYRKSEKSCYSKDTGSFLAQVFLATPNLRRLHLRITPSSHRDLQFNITNLNVKLTKLEEFTVYASEDSVVFVNAIIWVCDRFPSIRNLIVQIGNEGALQKLRRRLQHSHVSISPVPATPM